MNRIFYLIITLYIFSAFWGCGQVVKDTEGYRELPFYDSSFYGDLYKRQLDSYNLLPEVMYLNEYKITREKAMRRIEAINRGLHGWGIGLPPVQVITGEVPSDYYINFDNILSTGNAYAVVGGPAVSVVVGWDWEEAYGSGSVENAMSHEIGHGIGYPHPFGLFDASVSDEEKSRRIGCSKDIEPNRLDPNGDFCAMGYGGYTALDYKKNVSPIERASAQELYIANTIHSSENRYRIFGGQSLAGPVNRAYPRSRGQSYMKIGHYTTTPNVIGGSRFSVQINPLALSPEVANEMNQKNEDGQTSHEWKTIYCEPLKLR